MTTYAYRLSLDDSEVIALEEAITRYEKYCAEQLEAGSGAPYFAHSKSLHSIREKLESDVEQRIGSISRLCLSSRFTRIGRGVLQSGC